ncbi:bleomycin resistance family protein [Schlegelella sp. S2-27]|uniref:Bleomycin resistance family protein n=1 Tax=Caldimonas mangrovi TaxID=2944811 RepID=A0ABT0YWE5_9BURK|nr:VOC family protein [Caldimonas mangrovi]MCM5682667.1 bleomycin resistance family protein [Caldimonas mangrovi]
MTLSVLLRCNDLNETRRFYESTLGFIATATAERTVTLEKGGAKLLFTEQDLWHGDPACTGTLYITIPDVDDFHVRVRGLAPLAWELQDMPYGSREFGIKDCNGYLLAFQQKQ